MIQGETESNLGRKILCLGCVCALLSNCSVEDTAPPADDSPRRSVADATLTKEQREEIGRLEAIGYLSGTRAAPARSGIVRHHERSASPGLNLYISGHAPVAILMDMHGREKHRWSINFHEVWPDSPAEDERENRNTRSWRRAYLYENGDLLAIFEGLGILKLDRDSNVIWSNDVRAHHDLEVMPDGKIYVLTREAHLVPRLREKLPILEDYISILTPDGRESKRVSLLKAFERSEFLHILDGSRMYTQAFQLGADQDNGDIFHTNTLEVLDGRIAAQAPAFASGRVLVSLRVPSVLAIVDLEDERVVWARKGDYRRQHDPKIIANGNLLLFDNVGLRNRSRVLEIDPTTDETLWSYSGTQEDPFLTRACGAAQRLPNGNTLITETNNGRAFEITKTGEIVWEFISPHRIGPEDGLIATLYEVIRLPVDFPTDWAHDPIPLD